MVSAILQPWTFLRCLFYNSLLINELLLKWLICLFDCFRSSRSVIWPLLFNWTYTAVTCTRWNNCACPVSTVYLIPVSYWDPLSGAYGTSCVSTHIFVVVVMAMWFTYSTVFFLPMQSFSVLSFCRFFSTTMLFLIWLSSSIAAVNVCHLRTSRHLVPGVRGTETKQEGEQTGFLEITLFSLGQTGSCAEKQTAVCR